MTSKVLRKLEEAFAYGATDKEACFYAGISTSTLYKFQQGNEWFSERKEALKAQPILLARKTVVEAIALSPNTAKWYLERKKADEFGKFVERPVREEERHDLDEESKKRIAKYLD